MSRFVPNGGPARPSAVDEDDLGSQAGPAPRSDDSAVDDAAASLLGVHLPLYVEARLIERFDVELAREYEVVPLQLVGGCLVVAAENRLDADQLEELSRRAGVPVRAIPSQAASFDAAMRSLYDHNVLGRRDKALGEILIELGFLTEHQLAQALAHQMRENSPSFAPVLSIDPALLRIVPEALARRHNVLPLYRSADSLMLAAAEQLTDTACREVENATDLSPVFVMVGPDALQDALTTCYQAHQRFDLRQMWLGEILISRELITRRALDLCLAAQRGSRKKLGQLLVENDYISEDTLFPILAEKLGMDYRRLQNPDVDQQLTYLVSERFAERNLVLPLRLDHDRNLLEVAISDPTNLQVRDMLHSVAEAQGARLKLILSGPSRVREAIRHAYAANRRLELGLGEVELGAEAGAHGDPGPWTTHSEELAKMRRIVNKLLYEAITEGASDIYIENLETRTQVRFRVDGVLHERSTPINRGNIRKIIAALETDAGGGESDGRRTGGGVITMRLGGDRSVDFHVGVHDTQFGEDAVIRVLDRARKLFSLDEVGFPPALRERYEALLSIPQGLILFTGPAGSGKSTTLYSTLAHLNRGGREVATAEDPSEYRLDGVIQYEVDHAIGDTLADCTERAIAERADVVAVGEIRDRDVARACLDAAASGRLVLGTLRSNDAVSAIHQLRDQSVDTSVLAATLQGIVQQRLARRCCPDCRVPHTPEPMVLRELFSGGKVPAEARFARGSGCARCHGKGLRGRIGLFELWKIDERTRRVIASGADDGALRRSAGAHNPGSLVADALTKVYRGIITIEEVRRVLPLEEIRAYSGFYEVD